jgi:hypothetical protein
MRMNQPRAVRGSGRVYIVPAFLLVLLVSLPWLLGQLLRNWQPGTAYLPELLSSGIILLLGAWILYLIIREQRNVVVVPERLVQFDSDGSATWVELPGSAPGAEPRRADIEVGLSDGLNIEVVSGLDEGDRVVQRPPRDVLDEE